jgi:hypothetical protein
MAIDPHSRLGFHYFPDEAHYNPQDLQTWLPQLHALGAAWLVLRAGPDRLIPEAFVRGLVEAGIQPVVWMVGPVSALRAKPLAPALNSYHRWGVQYVVPGDRPNLRSCWSAGEWSRAGLVERTVDRLLPLLQLMRSIGLRPVFPPLEPGGDYWDTAFLQSAIGSLMRRGQHDLVRAMTVAAYGWTYGRPLDWGAGGPARWSDSQPYAAAEDSPDQRGIHLSDWYSAALTQTFGQTLPLLIVAGGALRGPLGQGFQEAYIAQSTELLQMVIGPQAPAGVVCFAFYPLAAAAGDPDAPFAWFDTSGRPRLVEDIGRLRPAAGSAAAHSHLADSQTGQDPAGSSLAFAGIHGVGGTPDPSRVRPVSPPSATPASDKPLEHYLLLGEASAAALARGLERLGGLPMEQRAVVGFSSAQARMARQVTILGDEQAVPAWIEHGLRQHGCQVKRVPMDFRAGSAEPTPYPPRTTP